MVTQPYIVPKQGGATIYEFSVSGAETLRVHRVLPFREQQTVASLLQAIVVSLDQVYLGSFVTVCLLQIQVLPYTTVSNEVGTMYEFPVQGGQLHHSLEQWPPEEH